MASYAAEQKELRNLVQEYKGITAFSMGKDGWITHVLGWLNHPQTTTNLLSQWLQGQGATGSGGTYSNSLSYHQQILIKHRITIEPLPGPALDARAVR